MQSNISWQGGWCTFRTKKYQISLWAMYHPWKPTQVKYSTSSLSLFLWQLRSSKWTHITCSHKSNVRSIVNVYDLICFGYPWPRSIHEMSILLHYCFAFIYVEIGNLVSSIGISSPATCSLGRVPLLDDEKTSQKSRTDIGSPFQNIMHIYIFKMQEIRSSMNWT